MCGTPVLCSNVGALPELVNNSNGVLCDNNLVSWLNGIQLIFNRKFNYQEISENIIEKYSVKAIGENINSIYNSITYL